MSRWDAYEEMLEPEEKPAGKLLDLKERACQTPTIKAREVADFMHFVKPKYHARRHIHALVKEYGSKMIISVLRDLILDRLRENK